MQLATFFVTHNASIVFMTSSLDTDSKAMLLKWIRPGKVGCILLQIKMGSIRILRMNSTQRRC